MRGLHGREGKKEEMVASQPGFLKVREDVYAHGQRERAGKD